MSLHEFKRKCSKLGIDLEYELIMKDYIIRWFKKRVSKKKNLFPFDSYYRVKEAMSPFKEANTLVTCYIDTEDRIFIKWK